MREVRIFSPAVLQENSRIELNGNAARHVLQVLRLQPGQALTLFDGSGGEFPAVIDSAARSSVIVTTGTRHATERESGLQITLWHGLCKGERMDSVIQKATELGVQSVQPLLSDRSTVKLDKARTAKRLAHWQRVVASACEQCGRNRLPEVFTPAPLAQLLPSIANFDSALLLDPAGDHALAGALDGISSTAHLLLCTGPEGGFSDSELAAARDAGMQVTHMGPRVLRTETAPVAALAIAQMLAGDLQACDAD